METVNDKIIKRYLLGDLPASKMEHLESKIFKDDNFFEIIKAIEDEIIDDYINNNLSPKYRKLFEKKYSRNPKYQQRIKFAQTMQKSGIFRQRQSRGSIFDFFKKTIYQIYQIFQRIPEPIIAAAFVVLIVVNVWLIGDFNAQRNQLGQIQIKMIDKEKSEFVLRQQVEQLSAKNEQLSRQLDQEVFQQNKLQEKLILQAQEGATTTVLKLMPGLVRGTTEPEQLIIEKNLQLVTLQLQFTLYEDEKYSSYRVDLKTLDNLEIWSQYRLAPEPEGSQQLITLQLPVNSLTEDDYMIILSGKTSQTYETLETYYFRVTIKK